MIRIWVVGTKTGSWAVSQETQDRIDQISDAARARLLGQNEVASFVSGDTELD